MNCDTSLANSLVSFSSVGTITFPPGVGSASVTLAISSTKEVFNTATCQVSFDQLSLSGGAVIDPQAQSFSFSITDFKNNPFGLFSFSTSSMMAAPTVLSPGANFTLTIIRSVAAYEQVVVSVGVIGDAGHQIRLVPADGQLTFVDNQLVQSVSVEVVAPSTPQPVTSVNLVLGIFNTIAGTQGASIGNGTWTSTLDAYGAPGGVIAMTNPNLTATLGSIVSVPINRRGGSAGVVNVTYTIAPGRLDLLAGYEDKTGGVVTLGAGELSGSILIKINASTIPAMAQSVSVIKSSEPNIIMHTYKYR